MYKYLTALALVLALAVWSYSDLLFPPEPLPTAASAPTVPVAPLDEASPGYVGTIVVNGVAVRIFEPSSAAPLEMPIAPLPPSTVAHPQFRLNTWMNGHSAWAGLTTLTLGPIVAVTGVLMIWLFLISGRRLSYRRA